MVQIFDQRGLRRGLVPDLSSTKASQDVKTRPHVVSLICFSFFLTFSSPFVFQQLFFSFGFAPTKISIPVSLP